MDAALTFKPNSSEPNCQDQHVESLRSGTVEIIVQDSLVIQIEKTERIRLTKSGTAEKYPTQFGKLELFSVEKVFGDWASAQKTHFREGGVFDQLYKKSK